MNAINDLDGECHCICWVSTIVRALVGPMLSASYVYKQLAQHQRLPHSDRRRKQVVEGQTLRWESNHADCSIWLQGFASPRILQGTRNVGFTWKTLENHLGKQRVWPAECWHPIARKWTFLFSGIVIVCHVNVMNKMNAFYELFLLNLCFY